MAAAARTDEIIRAVAARGGMARRTALRAAGHSDRDVASAVASGRLRSVRRRWVATPDADPHLLAAARHGVVLGCITVAARLGLWVLDAREPHVVAPPHAGRVQVPAAVTHWHRAIVPRSPDSLEDNLPNALVSVARCQPVEAALAVWESALNKKLVAREALEALDLPGCARALLTQATPWADSGLESFVIPRLRWMRVRILPQIWLHGHRVDFLIGDRLVFQVDGATHTGAQRDADIRHDAELMLLGYHVVRVGYRQVVDDWPAVQWLLMQAIAQRRHLAG